MMERHSVEREREREEPRHNDDMGRGEAKQQSAAQAKWSESAEVVAIVGEGGGKVGSMVWVYGWYGAKNF